ncbi:NDR1/HIN1-like protein 6 [Impatiens glandulifera]|uniref:NDR1/HIN1-like protein 6 n=1 Tax=Impatiens glandulifera TaxID=253017 RepID=UPI001FB0A827|nr:NDR1/HIN1-like protein 6 [Impatiens glandulifera]
MQQNVGRPRPPPPYGGRSGCCLKCICCFYCIIFLFLIILTVIALFIYLFFKPQLPSYYVEDLQVQGFNVRNDLSLVAKFLVVVKSENQNENIGLIYGEGSSVSVLYSDLILCSGTLPSFYQGPKNITIMDVLMRGENRLGSGLKEAMMDQMNNHKIPLLVMVKVPLRIVVADLPTTQVTVFVNCSMLVDNLSPFSKLQIIITGYSVGFQI